MTGMNNQGWGLRSYKGRRFLIMLIVFNRLIPTEKPLWRDTAFSGEKHVKEQRGVLFIFLTTFLGEPLGGFLVGCDIEGCGGPLCQGWLGPVAFLPSREETGSTSSV